MEVDFFLPSERMKRYLQRIITWRGKKQLIRCHDEPEYTGAAVECRAADTTIMLEHTQQSHLQQNPYFDPLRSTVPTSGCYSTTSANWLRLNTMTPSEYSLTTMTDPIWSWAQLHPSSDWKRLRIFFSSTSLATGEDYQFRRVK